MGGGGGGLSELVKDEGEIPGWNTPPTLGPVPLETVQKAIKGFILVDVQG